MPIRVSNIEKLLEEYLKRVIKEFNDIKREEQLDKVPSAEQTAAADEQIDNHNCNSDEEES